MGTLKNWVQRLKSGDQSAFLPLYERTAPGLLRFLLWKTNGNRPLAEDILQDSFVKFLIHVDQMESDEELAVQSYLFRIVRNCLIDKVGRAAVYSKPHIPLDGIAEMEDSKAANRQEQAVEVRELAIAMQSLNEKDSEIIWLRDGLGYSHKEVAQQFGLTEEASRQAYSRAKKNLFSELAHSLLPQREVTC